MHAVFCHYANKSISPSLFLSKDSRTHQVIQQVMSLVFIAQLCRISVNRGKKTPFFLPSLLWHVKPTLSGINLIPGSGCLLYWHSQQPKKCFNWKKKKRFRLVFWLLALEQLSPGSDGTSCGPPSFQRQRSGADHKLACAQPIYSPRAACKSPALILVCDHSPQCAAQVSGCKTEESDTLVFQILLLCCGQCVFNTLTFCCNSLKIKSHQSCPSFFSYTKMQVIVLK